MENTLCWTMTLYLTATEPASYIVCILYAVRSKGLIRAELIIIATRVMDRFIAFCSFCKFHVDLLGMGSGRDAI